MYAGSGPGVGGVRQVHEVSSAQVAKIHSIDNCVVLGKYFRGLTVAVRAVEDFSGPSWSSSWGPGQGAAVAESMACTRSTSGSSDRDQYGAQGWLQTHMQCWKSGPAAGALVAVRVLVVDKHS